MITPNQIKEKILSTASHGYDIDETDVFLNEVYASYDSLYNENKQLYKKMDVLANKIEEYREEEDNIKATLITAQKAADQLTRGTKEKAEALLRETDARANATVANAKEKAEAIVAEANKRAEEITASAQGEKDAVVNAATEKAEKTVADANSVAEKTIADADEYSEKTVQSANKVASDLLLEAKSVSSDLVEKAKEESEYYDSLTEKLKADSAYFKEQLVSLYEAQLKKLTEMMEAPVLERDSVQNRLDSVEEIINSIFAEEEADEETEENTEGEAKDTDEISLEDVASEYKEELTLDFDEVGAEEDAEEETAEATEEEEPAPQVQLDFEYEDISSDYTAEEREAEGDVEEINIPAEENIENIKTAVDAFSEDEITPITSDAKIREIEEEAELEEPATSFEDFFNVGGDVRTEEKVSLVSPEEQEDDDDDDLKYRGFFKKRRKK